MPPIRANRVYYMTTTRKLKNWIGYADAYDGYVHDECPKRRQRRGPRPRSRDAERKRPGTHRGSSQTHKGPMKQ